MSSLSDKTVVQLKALLKKEGLSVSGKKAELVSRLASKTKKASPTKKKSSPVKKSKTPVKKTKSKSPTKKISIPVSWPQITPSQAAFRVFEVTGYLLSIFDEVYITDKKITSSSMFDKHKDEVLEINVDRVLDIQDLPWGILKTSTSDKNIQFSTSKVTISGILTLDKKAFLETPNFVK